MAGLSPNEAFQNYIGPLREALRCITEQRLTLRERARLTIDVPYTVALANMDSAPLGGAFRLRFRAGQIVRIVGIAEGDDPQRRFEVRAIQYLYAFSTPEDQEVLSFHWIPEAVGVNVVTTPHLHIGPAITAGQTVVRPGDLHKAHVPTGRISVAAVVHLAISEIGVVPLLPNWAEILERTEDVLSQ